MNNKNICQMPTLDTSSLVCVLSFAFTTYCLNVACRVLQLGKAKATERAGRNIIPYYPVILHPGRLSTKVMGKDILFHRKVILCIAFLQTAQGLSQIFESEQDICLIYVQGVRAG